MVRYKMIGRDVDLNITQYRTWVVDNEPDFSAQYYTGLKSGNNPFVDVQAYAILDSSVIADFNFPFNISFPDVVTWSPMKKVLPEALYEGQIAIIDGYDGYDGYSGSVYIFGGKYSNSILKASLSRPAEWQVAGHLPSAISGSQLAIIDGYIYLFGGADTQSTDHIYSASISNPLDWTDHGPLLPKRLQNSQLAIIDNYIYLFGGYEITHATSAILRAPANDPLNWVDTGMTLPIPLYNSHLGIIDNNVYLFGGQNFDGNPVNSIFTASLSNPTTWSTSLFILPFEVCCGQFFTIGDKGYLITPTNAAVNEKYQTKILQCSLSSPLQWGDTGKTIPGNVSSSHLAVIYDRAFLFGGNGNSAIFANNYMLKYSFTNPSVVAYGNVTRTQYNNTPNKLDLFKVLGFPPWKTDYGA